MKTATFVRKVNSFVGDARLYSVSPQFVQEDYDGNKSHYNYVIVSATVVPFSGPETYIFPASDVGEVLDWGELDGSFRGGLDHHKALENAGYRVLEKV